MNKLEKDEDKERRSFLFDKTSIIQVIMIVLIIVVYSVFLFVQQFLYSFEGFRNKIIIINILLAVGLTIEIGHFIWIQYKRKQKQKSKLLNNKKEAK